MRPRRTSFLASLVLMTLVHLGCHRRPEVDETYAADLAKQRADRLTALTADSGWLTVTGLFWLEPGENAFGAEGSNPILLAGSGVPARAGVFVLGPDGSVRLRPDPGATVTVNGFPPSDAPLATDKAAKPDKIGIGSLALSILERGGRLAVRVRDPQSPARKSFRGIPYFPTDPAWRVTAIFETYPIPREVDVPSAQGPPQKMLAPGRLRFHANGRDLVLEPYLTRPDSQAFFIVFSDATAGKETYGAGRFLDAPLPRPGTARTTLDFNRAYNPPCAFTAYATCPLPSRENSLPVRVEAGEKAPSTGH
ncbi:MAG: DUF1684 domain-containing protein [Thermoanaerobaculia bacterium]|nr:DUF1684 domain-containing protein [Thermoanaerobaculia bacterium]